MEAFTRSEHYLSKNQNVSIMKQAKSKEIHGWIRKLPRILEAVDKYKAILYFEDESNISLTAVLGKTWAPCGRDSDPGSDRESRVQSQRCQLLVGVAFCYFPCMRIEKRIASDEVIYFLEQMLKHHKRRHLVVVMDQAPPHTSKKTKEFIKKQNRLHVFLLTAVFSRLESR